MTDEELQEYVADAKRIATQEDAPDHDDLASMANSVWELAGMVRRLRAELAQAEADKSFLREGAAAWQTECVAVRDEALRFRDEAIAARAEEREACACPAAVLPLTPPGPVATASPSRPLLP